jgi:molybdate transport system substrate-binding protein
MPLGCQAVVAALLLALGAWSGPPTPEKPWQRPPIVAAAGDLNPAATEVAEQFARETGERVEVVFASSGTLTRQIRDGAPFEVFLSADHALVEQLADLGLTRDRGRLYAIGRLVFFSPNGSPFNPQDGYQGLVRLLDAGRLTRFAIANPAHAPSGRAAEAALRKHGLWDRIRAHLVIGEHLPQAAQFTLTGNAVGGIIAHSQIHAPFLKDRGTWALVPEEDHPPLRQGMVLLKRAGPVAERFYQYMQEPAARAILKRYGFTEPVRPQP